METKTDEMIDRGLVKVENAFVTFVARVEIDGSRLEIPFVVDSNRDVEDIDAPIEGQMREDIWKVFESAFWEDASVAFRKEGDLALPYRMEMGHKNEVAEQLEAPPEMIIIKNTDKRVYILDYNDMDETDLVSPERILEYAQNRFEANEEERADWSFDTFDMSTEQAIGVIRSFGETVEELHRNKIIDDILSNKLSGADCVDDICGHMLFDNEIKDYVDYLADVQERYENLDFGLDVQAEYLNFENEIREAKVMFVENNVANGNHKDAGEFLAKNNMCISDVVINIDENHLDIVAEHMMDYIVEQTRLNNKVNRADAKSMPLPQAKKL